MLEKYSVRTDLALEEKERFESENVEVPGVILEESYDEERDRDRKGSQSHGQAHRDLYYAGSAESVGA